MSAAALDAVGPTAPHLVQAALRLHAQLEFRHLHGGRIEGPDQGVRWNIRVWRFWKSYFPALSPRERHYFLQGQGYWALANWALFDLTREPRFHQRAWEATEVIDHTQRLTGAWIYPLRERRRLVATVEGDFAAIAMLEAYQRGLGDHMLEAAKRWHDFVELSIGYQDHPGGIAINYFDRPRGLVPNNTAEWIWVLGRFATVTGDDRFLGRVPRLLGFLEAVQLPTGELPYELAGRYEKRERIHYLCYQYNAFQCMKLAWYAAAHDDKRARAIAIRLANYIAGGVTASGAVRASCHSVLPEVVYYADAVGMALHTVTRLGWADYGALADRAFAWVLTRQRADGGFPFSRGDYLVLSDRNAYPRYLAMTLYHLAERARTAGPTP
ncbi:MAG TPA: hypothetical protein VJY35_08425 [Candidatus Eisenbacteria bacterium]|nr:hypothetical protein [Candidatus Eisenbacteria bacterium]